jgi:NADH-quinone oxidoreductase subunit L
MSFMATIGAVTALFAATIALAQKDVKKVLAYSTISQLGFMVMAVGAHSPSAGMFHLSTHAFFKSLLFLTAGAFIHRFHSNDIWEIARGGGKKDLLAMGALIVGLFSLSAIPPFAGFFSKDMILEAIKHDNRLIYGLALLASFLTAFYSFRLLFILLFAKPAAKAHGNAHAHAHGDHASHSSPLLTLACAIPLVSLAALSLFMGALGTPLADHAILHWLDGHAAEFDWEIFGSTSVLTLIAVIMAFLRFRDPDAAEKRLEASNGPLATALKNKWYVDDVYAFLTRNVGLGISTAFDWFDRKFVNGILVNATSFRILDAG